MLSPEQFAEIIALIQTTQDDGIKSEVRRAPRIPHPCHLSIALGTPSEPGATFVVDMIDISHRGISFLHAGELAVGTSFVVRLEASNANSVVIECRIVHFKTLTPPTVQFGAEFTNVIDRHEIALPEPRAEDLMTIRSHLVD
ncbi:MAG TPA: PilZ domain-containing protein [Humisphaera sp.]|nr:PilZ domain-containing protein [Humisphaera sp.]